MVNPVNPWSIPQFLLLKTYGPFHWFPVVWPGHLVVDASAALYPSTPGAIDNAARLWASNTGRHFHVELWGPWGSTNLWGFRVTKTIKIPIFRQTQNDRRRNRVSILLSPVVTCGHLWSPVILGRWRTLPWVFGFWHFGTSWVTWMATWARRKSQKSRFSLWLKIHRKEGSHES